MVQSGLRQRSTNNAPTSKKKQRRDTFGHIATLRDQKSVAWIRVAQGYPRRSSMSYSKNSRISDINSKASANSSGDVITTSDTIKSNPSSASQTSQGPPAFQNIKENVYSPQSLCQLTLSQTEPSRCFCPAADPNDSKKLWWSDGSCLNVESRYFFTLIYCPTRNKGLTHVGVFAKFDIYAHAKTELTFDYGAEPFY